MPNALFTPGGSQPTACGPRDGSTGRRNAVLTTVPMNPRSFPPALIVTRSVLGRYTKSLR